MAGNKYGIKEVADVKFYEVNSVTMSDQGVLSEGTPIVTFDSLKVSNIEFSEEQTEAKGGKGNPTLMIWDHSKEINVTLEDALFTDKSLAVMLGLDPSTYTGEADAKYTVTPETFADTYTVHGSTYARDEDGKDYVLEFFIPKAKLVPEQTFTMEADGEPTVFNFNLKVLRGDAEGTMIRFYKHTKAKA